MNETNKWSSFLFQIISTRNLSVFDFLTIKIDSFGFKIISFLSSYLKYLVLLLDLTDIFLEMNVKCVCNTSVTILINFVIDNSIYFALLLE